MLVRIALKPEVFCLSAMDPDDRETYCALVTSVVMDMQHNGLVLTDSDNVVRKEIGQHVSRWPQAYRDKLQELLSQLHKKNRLVSHSVGTVSNRGCSKDACGIVHHIAKEQLPELAIGVRGCRHCELNGYAGCYADPYMYPLWDDAAHGLSVNALTFDGAVGEIARFEKSVLIPCLRYASNVRLIDRFIGGHLTGLKQAIGKIKVRKTVARSFEWFFEAYRDANPNGSRNVEILTCINVDTIDYATAAAQRQALEQFFTQLGNRYDISVVVTVKRETWSDQFQHARYMITEQIALQVERGFELLDSGNQLKDVEISIAGDAEKVYRKASSRQDV